MRRPRQDPRNVGLIGGVGGDAGEPITRVEDALGRLQLLLRPADDDDLGAAAERSCRHTEPDARAATDDNDFLVHERCHGVSFLNFWLDGRRLSRRRRLRDRQ